MLWEKIKNYKNEFVLFLCQHSIKLYNDTKLERKCRQKFAIKNLPKLLFYKILRE